MSTEVKACIFDLDGVIVDTAKYHYLAWRRLAEELGFEFTKEQNERLKGVSRVRSLEILLSIGQVKLSEAEKLEAMEKKNSWYREYITKMDSSEILPGVLNFLDELKSKGIKLALGSASKNAMTILKQVDLLDYFDAVIDGTKVCKAKPDPEVFLLGAESLQVAPKDCVVFEDAEAGIEAANRAGMYSVGVGSSSILHEADKVISGFANKTLYDILP